MIGSLKENHDQVILFKGNGRKPGEQSVVLMNGNRKIYYGFVSGRSTLAQPGRIIKKLKEAMDIPTVYQVVNSYLIDPRDMEVHVVGG